MSKNIERNNGGPERLRYRVDGDNRDSELPSQGAGESLTPLKTHKIPPLATRFASLQEAVEFSLRGTHSDDFIFIFCRALKAFEVTNGRLPKAELGAAFALLISTAQARGLIPKTADFDEYRFDFLHTYERTRVPLGANPLEEAIRLAESKPGPPESARYPSPRIKRLISVCYHLQVLALENPFFLGVRDAAKILGAKRLAQASASLAGLAEARQRRSSGEHPILHDPIEDEKATAQIIKDIQKEVDAAVDQNLSMGRCHVVWGEMKEILEQRHGIQWYSPDEMNPNACFD